MVDRITKITPDHMRVDETKDSLEDEKNQQSGDEADEDGQQSDIFDKSAREALWGTERAEARFQDLKLEASEIDRVIFNEVILKSDPAWLVVSVILRGGRRLNMAYLPVPRPVAMRFKTYERGRRVDHKPFLREGGLALKVSGQHETSESTTINPKETTLSRTLKMLRLRWWHRLGLKDPETNSNNLEIMLAYATVIVVLSAVLFAVWLIMT